MKQELLDQIKDTKYYKYASDVLSGKQLACEYVKLACQRFFNFLENPDFEFRPKIVRKFVKFCRLLKQFTGEFNNKPLILEPWQEFVAANIFGFYYRDTDRRVTRNVYIEIPRKTGKSLYAAAMGLYCLIADNEPNAEIDVVATTSKQAGIVFNMCKNLADSIGGREYFKKYRDSLRFLPSKGLLQVLSSDAGLQDGFNPYVFICDETHAYRDSALYDVLKSGQGMRRNPLAICLTTAGFLIGGFCHTMRQVNIDILKGLKTDDSQFSIIYTLDEGDDWRDQSLWKKAAPNLGVTVKYEYYLEQLNQANNNPQLEVSTKTKLFNIWCQSSQTWIPDKYIVDSMQKLTYDDLKSHAYYCYQGIDLASVSDLTALSTMVYDEEEKKYYFKTEYFVPQTTLHESENNFIYQQWVKEGFLNVTPGNVTDHDYILKKQLEIRSQIQVYQCAYDAFNATQYTVNCTHEGFDMIPFSQSLGSFNRPTKEFERLILSGKVVIDFNPITRWNFQNVALKIDFYENVKPVKGSGQENKIDGCISMLQALGLKIYQELPDLSIVS